MICSHFISRIYTHSLHTLITHCVVVLDIYVYYCAIMQQTWGVTVSAKYFSYYLVEFVIHFEPIIHAFLKQNIQLWAHLWSTVYVGMHFSHLKKKLKIDHFSTNLMICVFKYCIHTAYRNVHLNIWDSAKIYSSILAGTPTVKSALNTARFNMTWYPAVYSINKYWTGHKLI